MKELQEKRKSNIPGVDDITEYFNSHASGKVEDDLSKDFTTAFVSHAHSKVCIDLLRKLRITPDTVNLISKLYLLYKNEPTSALLLINRKMMIKDIVVFSVGYRPMLSDFTDDISFICDSNKCKKCIVIYNFMYKASEFDELFDINRLYMDLNQKGINLVDAVRVCGGNAISHIQPYNKKGYQK